jgi:hypothetical protein
MATDTKPRTPGTKIPQQPPGTPKPPRDPRDPSPQAKPPKPASQAKPPSPAKPAKPPRRPSRAPRGPGGNGFPPDGGSPGGRPPGEKGRPPGEISSPRHTRPSVGPRSGQGADQPLPEQRRPRQQRMPFILLLVGLLGGALISLLVISTTLDEGSYDINNLTSQNNMLYKDEQALINQVNQEKNPAVIASEASQLGLRTQKDERFINPSTGAIIVAPAVTPEP